MLGERLIRTGRPKKGYRAWVLSYPDIRFDGFIANDDAVFFGIPLSLYDNLRGMYDVYDKKTKEQADDEGKIRILGKPVEHVENVRVYEKIRKRAESRPYEQKFRTENTSGYCPIPWYSPTVGPWRSSGLRYRQYIRSLSCKAPSRQKVRPGSKPDPGSWKIPPSAQSGTTGKARKGQIRFCAEAGTNPPASRIGRRKKRRNRSSMAHPVTEPIKNKNASVKNRFIVPLSSSPRARLLFPVILS